VQYNVIIIGAGPAGSTAAYECAKSGLTTLLLEKYSLPREKPCGGAVMAHGLKLIKEKIPKRLVERPIHGLRFVLPCGTETEFISENVIGITTLRSRFDEFLTTRAVQNGAELRENAHVVNVTTNHERANVTLKNGETYEARFIIGADGVNSVVSRAMGLRPKRKNLTKIGLGMESDVYVGEAGVLKAMNGKPTILEMFPAENKISYGWIFPKREHLGIGIAGAAVHMIHLRPIFNQFCKTVEERIGMPLDIDHRRTHFLGGDGLHNKNVFTRGVLIGDAAGFVDPMMGEGIAYAMKSGVYASQVISEAANKNRYDEDFLTKYELLCKQSFGDHFATAAWAGIKGTSFAEFVLRRANGFKLASDIMAMVARGEIKYSDIPFTILTRLPKELPSIIRHVVQSRIT
jgi:geranylgeranyl reductase family protein